MNAASQHLVEAFRATKARNEGEEMNRLTDLHEATCEARGCVLDLPAILDALATLAVIAVFVAYWLLAIAWAEGTGAW